LDSWSWSYTFGLKLGLAALDFVLSLVSATPLPFFRSVATVAVAGENGNAEKFRMNEVTRTLIGCPPTAERQK